MKFLLLLILFIQKFDHFLSIGSHLTLEIYPSLYEHSAFSYAIDVQCIDLNDKKWKKVYGSIWKNFMSHPMIKNGKMVEMIIFQFENHVCRQFDVSVRALKWTLTKTANESSPIPNVALATNSGSIVYYNELPVIYGSVDHQIDLGKHFVLNIVPLLKDEAFYELKLYCSEKMEFIVKFQVNAKMCTMGCSKMIFNKKVECPADEYDITIWKWNNVQEKASITRKEVGVHYSRLMIKRNEEYQINYDLKRN